MSTIGNNSHYAHIPSAILGRTNSAKLYYFWDMPHRNTFKIPTVKMILNNYSVGLGWIDPFANLGSPAEITNDIDESMPTTYHLDALDFLLSLKGTYKGILLDPPYSMHQAVHTYNNKKLRDLTPVYDRAACLVDISIHFGWNSNGLGLRRGFVTEEIYLIAHGGSHNDTIVTIQRKIDRPQPLSLF